MIIEFRCEAEHARHWMNRTWLPVDGRDVPVQIAWVASTGPRPAGLQGLFELERMVLRKGKPGGADKWKVSERERPNAAGAADVVVDFTTGARDARCAARRSRW